MTRRPDPVVDNRVPVRSDLSRLCPVTTVSELCFTAMVRGSGAGGGLDAVLQWAVTTVPGPPEEAPWPVTVVSPLGGAAVQAARQHGGDVARCVRTMLTPTGMLVPDLMANNGAAIDSILLFCRPPGAAPALQATTITTVRQVLGRASTVVAAYPEHLGDKRPATLRPWRDAGFRAYRDGLWMVPSTSMR